MMNAWGATGGFQNIEAPIKDRNAFKCEAIDAPDYLSTGCTVKDSYIDLTYTEIVLREGA